MRTASIFFTAVALTVFWSACDSRGPIEPPSLAPSFALTGIEVLWSDDFSGSKVEQDWEPLAYDEQGISHRMNDPFQCLDDDNDDCLNVDMTAGGESPYFLDKKTDIDMSSCAAGTAQFRIAFIFEPNVLDGDDCVHVWYSNDGGSTWGDRTQIFCDDNPPSAFSTSVPDAYHVDAMRLRLEANGFTSAREDVFLDEFSIECQVSPTSKDDCRNGEWAQFGFGNQGLCIRYIETGKDSRVGE